MDFGQVLTAMITPFKDNGEIDYALAEKLAVWLCDNGSDGLVVHGTTGESPTLTHDEEYELYRVVKKAVGKKGKIVAGTGSNSTATTVTSTLAAEKADVDGIMVVVPYYNRPSQEGLYQHFRMAADSTDLPIIIYNIPGRTGTNMTPETVARLAEISNITAIKEASGNLDQVSQVRALTPANFAIYSGDDSLTLPILSVGGCGIISVASHIVGNEIKEMITAFKAGQTDKALEMHLRLLPLFKVLFITTNPVPIKAAINMLGDSVGKPRLPLVEATEAEKDKIRAEMVKLGILKK